MTGGTFEERRAQRAELERQAAELAARLAAEDLYIPEHYTSQKGNPNVKMGQIIATPTVFRKLIASIKDEETCAELERICDEVDGLRTAKKKAA